MLLKKKKKEMVEYQNPMKGGVGFYWKKCRKFPPPPCDRFFFLGNKFFFGFSEKFLKFCFNEIDCKKFSNFFCDEFSSKKFFNSLKMTIKNFRFFCFNEIDCKKFLNFFSMNSAVKTFSTA